MIYKQGKASLMIEHHALRNRFALLAEHDKQAMVVIEGLRAVLADIRAQNVALKELVGRAVGVSQRYLPPDGITRIDALGEFIEIFDGPQYRAVMGIEEVSALGCTTVECDHEWAKSPDHEGFSRCDKCGAEVPF
jgi:hypothetical protein